MMDATSRVIIQGFALELDRGYEPTTHMWVRRVGADRVRVGMDSLGIETSGTLAQLSFDDVGSDLIAGQRFGEVEAAKFVGPLISPVDGVLLEVNGDAIFDAGIVERFPYGAGWLIDVRVRDASEALAGLLTQPAEIIAWFNERIAHYRAKGVLSL